MTDNGSRVALVTGGSRGIGRACATRLAADGYNVAVCYRSNETAAREVEKAVLETGQRALAVPAEVSDGDSVRAVVSRVTEELGPLDVVVTSAGITRDNPLVMMRDDQWHEVLDVNLDGVYHVCRAAVFEMMKRRRGKLINISSVAGVYGHAMHANYSASKAGIIGFTKSLAKEVARFNIQANVVAPGFIETEMTEVLSDKVRAESLKSIPMGRFGRVEEVADLVSYLSTDGAAYITGSVLQVDGGIAF